TTTNPFAGGATRILMFHTHAGLQITNNTITGIAPFSTNPNYQNNRVAFLHTQGGHVTRNNISGFGNRLGEFRRFTAPLTHGANPYTGNATNVNLQADGTTGITFSGSEGPDNLDGSTGNDTLTGLGGDDTIDGDAGTDTAVYTTTLSAANFGYDK